MINHAKTGRRRRKWTLAKRERGSKGLKHLELFITLNNKNYYWTRAVFTLKKTLKELCLLLPITNHVRKPRMHLISRRREKG